MQTETVARCTSCDCEDTQEVVRQGPYGVRRCQRCSLLFVSPRPNPEELSKLYQEEYFQGGGEFGNQEGYLAQERGYQARARFLVEWIARLAGLKGGRWLDVGCGPGYIVQAAQNLGFGAQGVDISPQAVEYGRERLGLQLQVSEAEGVDQVVQGPFQMITLFDTLFHLRSPREVVDQIFHLLAPGGWLFAGPFDLHEPDWKPTAELGDISAWGIPEHLSFVNQTSMTHMLVGQGFSQLRFLPMPETPSEVLAKKKWPLPAWLVRALRWLVRRIPLLQKMLHRAAGRVVNRQAGYVLARK